MNREIKSYDAALAFLEGERKRAFPGNEYNAVFDGAEGANIRLYVQGVRVLMYKPNGNIVILPEQDPGLTVQFMEREGVLDALRTFTPFEFTMSPGYGIPVEINTGKDEFMLYAGMEVEPSGWLVD